MSTDRSVEHSPRSVPGAAARLALASLLAVVLTAYAASGEREAHLQRAIAELRDGRPFPAVAEAAEAVRTDPGSAEALAILGLARLKCGEWEKARSRFNEAIAIDSLSPEAHLGLGVIEIAMMRYGDAIPHLRRATSSRLFPGAAYTALASSLEDLDLHREAGLAMREAGTYTDELAEDQLSNIRAFADIFASHDGLALCRVPEDFRSTSVRFRFSDSHIAVPVVLNGSTQGDFFFDTGHGGWMMLDDEYAEGLDLTYIGEITTISVAGPLVMKAAVLDSIRIGGLTMLNVPVLVCRGYPFGEAGLIGWMVIQKVNSTIDFKKRRIRFSSQGIPGPQWKNVAGGTRTACVPFASLTSLFVIARFGDGTPRAYVFDTGCDVTVLHYGDPSGPENMRKGTPCVVRIGDLAFDVPRIDCYDFTAIHEKGRYYFPGVIGLDVMTQCVLHIFPKESMLCLEKSGS